MKVRFYLLNIFVLFSFFSFGQLVEATFPPLNNAPVPKMLFKDALNQKKQDKSTPCGVDTLYYARYNNTYVLGYQRLTIGSNSGAGLFFNVDDTVWLHGFNFNAYAYLGFGLVSQNVTCRVYYANSNGTPAGVALASTTHQINATSISINGTRQRVSFANPVMLLSDFVVTVEVPNTNNSVVVFSNDWRNNDGLGMNYSCVKLSNGWSNNLVIQSTDTVPFDADFYLEPVVEYKMSAQYDHGLNSCLGNGKPFKFVNTTTFALNPQFSKEVLDSTLDDNFIWDYGDGSNLDTVVHGENTFPHTLGFFVNLDGEFTTWTGSTCRDDSTIFLEAGDVQAAFDVSNNGLVVSFKDKSLNPKFWEWDFGDGTPTSNAQNPNHVYQANGVYPVKLKVRNRGCVDSLTIALNLEFIGIDENAKPEISISPNPAREFLDVNIEYSGQERMTYEIYGIDGSLKESGRIQNKQRLPLDSYSQGVYFLKVLLPQDVITKRFVVE